MNKYKDWISSSQKGLEIKSGSFYIDPIAPVDKAIITHGHADHARSGHKEVYATPETLAIMELRYGKNFCFKSHSYNYHEKFMLDGISIFFAPSGHVLGSAQIVMECNNFKVICAGDFKRQFDPTCKPFEVVKSDIFITEATFGLPVFKHPDANAQVKKLLDSINTFTSRCHIIGVYSLGKAQRLIKLIRLNGWHEKIYLHGSLLKMCELYSHFGQEFGKLESATIKDKNVPPKDFYRGKMVLAPPSALGDRWFRRFPDPLTCMASGWMAVKQRSKQRGVELPLIISDHADWDDIFKTIEEVNPKEVWVTHGSEEAIIYECKRRNRSAKALSIIGYESENE